MEVLQISVRWIITSLKTWRAFFFYSFLISLQLKSIAKLSESHLQMKTPDEKASTQMSCLQSQNNLKHPNIIATQMPDLSLLIPNSSLLPLPHASKNLSTAYQILPVQTWHWHLGFQQHHFELPVKPFSLLLVNTTKRTFDKLLAPMSRLTI